MQIVVAYLAGVASGWMMRSAFGSLRGLTVSAVSTGMEMADKARRFVAVEKEFMEDLLAEAKARFEADRARRERPVRSAPKAVA